MAADAPAGSKNQPQFLGTGIPATAADLNTVSNFAAKVGNTRVDTDANRLAASGADLWEGLVWYCTDTDCVWRRGASSWVLVTAPRTAFTPTISNLTVGGGGIITAAVAVSEGLGRLDFEITLGSSPTVGDVTISWPAIGDGSALPDIFPLGDVALVDISAGAAGRFRGSAYKTVTGIRLAYSGNATIQQTALGPTNPFTWAATDRIVGSLHYPVL